MSRESGQVIPDGVNRGHRRAHAGRNARVQGGRQRLPS